MCERGEDQPGAVIGTGPSSTPSVGFANLAERESDHGANLPGPSAYCCRLAVPRRVPIGTHNALVCCVGLTHLPHLALRRLHPVTCGPAGGRHGGQPTL